MVDPTLVGALAPRAPKVVRVFHTEELFQCCTCGVTWPIEGSYGIQCPCCSLATKVIEAQRAMDELATLRAGLEADMAKIKEMTRG